MGILETLLGRKARTAATLADEITTQSRGIAKATDRLTRARLDRQSAIEAFDDVRHKAADDEIAAAGREIERGEYAVAELRAAHAAQVEVEAREAFRGEVAEAMRAAEALNARFVNEYRAAAETIAILMKEITAAGGRHAVLCRRARDLGEERPAYEVPLTSVPDAVGNLPSCDGSGGLIYMSPASLAAHHASTARVD